MGNTNRFTIPPVVGYFIVLGMAFVSGYMVNDLVTQIDTADGMFCVGIRDRNQKLMQYSKLQVSYLEFRLFLPLPCTEGWHIWDWKYHSKALGLKPVIYPMM